MLLWTAALRKTIMRSPPSERPDASTFRHAHHEFPHQSRCVRRLWHAVRHSVGRRRHRTGVSRVRRHRHPGLAYQAARIHLAAVADAALRGFLGHYARLAVVHAAMPWPETRPRRVRADHGKI